MKLPIQAQPVNRKVGTDKILDFMLVQPLSLFCSKKGEICGGFSDGSCCPGLECDISPGADYGYCIREKVPNVKQHPILEPWIYSK